MFDDMFSLPGGTDGQRMEVQDGQGYREGRPVVSVTETSRTLEILLRFSYPVEKPQLKDSKETCDVLEASMKYLMEGVEKQIRVHLPDLVKQHPLEFYALAARHGWKEEMKLSAKASLEIPFTTGTFVPEMEFMPAGAYMRLQMYRKACSDAATAQLVTYRNGIPWYYPALTDKSRVWFTCNHGPGEGSTPTFGSVIARPTQTTIFVASSSAILNSSAIAEVTVWVVDYLKTLKKEVRDMPCGEVVMNSSVLNQHIVDGMKSCTTCAPRVLSELPVLAQNLATFVEEAVATVELTFGEY